MPQALLAVGLILVVSSSTAAQSETWVLVSNGPGNKVLLLSWPQGELLGAFESGGLDYAAYMAIGPDGLLYVASSTGASISRFDPMTGLNLGLFIVSEGKEGRLWDAAQFAWGPDGKFYIASQHWNSVVRYDGLSGKYDGDFVPSEGSPLFQPRGLAFDSDGVLWVTSSQQNEEQIVRFAPDGTVIGHISLQSPDFEGAGYLSRDGDGNWYTPGYISNSVMKIDAHGLPSLLVPPDKEHLFAARGPALDPLGRLVVCTYSDGGGAMQLDINTGESLGTLFTGGVAGAYPQSLVFVSLCEPDLNGDHVLDLFDYLEFVNRFNADDPNADCDHNFVLDLFDFLCFVNEFNAGC